MIRDDQTQVGYSMVGRSGGRVTPCVIRIVHVEETRSVGFPVWPQNRWIWFVSGLASKSLLRFIGLGLKTKVYSLVIWVSKSPWRSLGSGLKTKCEEVCWFALKIDELMKTMWGHALTSDGLLCREASQARVSQFCLKTSKWATAGGACGIITEVEWKWSERWSVRWRQVQRSRCRTKLPFIRCNFSFSPQGHSSLLVFSINRTMGCYARHLSPTL
jgi:hypothetical protein